MSFKTSYFLKAITANSQDHPPSNTAQNDKTNNENPDGRYEALVSASANIVLTMLHRGRFLEDELKRALDHIRTSNEFLQKFVELLDSVDEERCDGKEGVTSWKEVAERVKSVVKGARGQDDEKDGSIVVNEEKDGLDGEPLAE
ncbi:uncharacterized protein BHQ10_000797 [Talaromyces amestolkiae]|uniref:Uncharacterized protein n=1 Tax=Talaromyces amestolkiae TaxID=1196081 RepID=A0A364KML6_TALAM|nr:uncharacterized protein BHQ10_000797 [Talaromyces amestolkiae]RAO64785.1 hypothetical protein BHQ10_000797 [Talaromyces amestolkiae]